MGICVSGTELTGQIILCISLRKQKEIFELTDVWFESDLAHKHLQTSQNLNNKILVLCNASTLIL